MRATTTERSQMTHHLRHTAIAAACSLGALLSAGGAHAQAAGSVLVRLGATQIKPNVDSGDLSQPSLAGSKVSIKSDTQLSGGITYLITDHWALDIPLALPYKHELEGDGSINGVGKIGEVKALPITLLGQYRFMESDSMWRPYVGAGLTYAKFYKARSTAALSALTGGTPSNPTTFSIKSKFAPTLQLGMTFAINQRWGIDASVTHTFLKTTTTLSTGQTIDTKLDPDSFGLSVVYAF